MPSASPPEAESVTVTGVAGAVSSSESVIVAGLTVAPPSVPETVTVSAFSAVASSWGVSVNVPVPVAAPAAMVMLNVAGCAVKPTTFELPEPATATATVC